MRKALFFIIVLLAVFFAHESRAEEYASALVGVANSGKNSHAETKFINVGHRDDIGLGLSYQYELGGWADIAGSGRSSSGYVATQFGVETDGPLSHGS